MSLNHVMLGETPRSYIPLPNEHSLHISPPRTSFSLNALGYVITSGNGVVHLTNQRVVFIPNTPSSTFESFSAPVTNFYDTRVHSPIFRPYEWHATVIPIPNGGIPASTTPVEVKLIFKDGGAFEFHENFTRVGERTQQAMENRGSRDDPIDVHLDDLPAYEPGDALPPPPPPSHSYLSSQQPIVIPDDPPPGYEEAQRESVENAFGVRGGGEMR